MQVAILAGGLATRLGKLTQNVPKSLLMVKKKPFLQYQLERLREHGIADVVLCTGHLGHQIQDHFGDGSRFGVNLVYSHEEKPLGTAGALRLAKDKLQDPFFTIYGDSYLSLDFAAILQYFDSRDRLALMTVYRNADLYDRSNTVVRGQLVEKYSKREKTQGMVYIDYGANLFSRQALELVPEGQFYSLEDLFIQLIEMKELLAYEVKERFYEIGSLEGLTEFREHMEKAEGGCSC
ncbi:MAG: NTP transferase domain-containing protein [Dehalococcoidia bacterium]|nr:NTP transferase domain-containing protein [Dehalococcoidia bacterium]